MKNTKTHEPLLRVVKRDGFPFWGTIIIYVAAIAVALLIGMIVLWILDEDPFAIYRKIFSMGIIGAARPGIAVKNFVKTLVPLLLTSVGLSLSFKMKFWNIGGEGQFIMGAIASTAAVILLGDKLPSWAVFIIMVAAAAVAAGLYGLIPALLKVKFGTNETLLTLMLNYVATYLLVFFLEMEYNPLPEWNIFLTQNQYGRKSATPFSEVMGYIKVGEFDISYALIFSIIICLIMYFYITKTKQGYELTVVGDSPNTAKYAGMKVGKIVIRTVVLSAMLIGIAAAFKMSSTTSLSTSVTSSVGWTGIVIAWLSKLNTFGIILTSTLITALQQGCSAASGTSSINVNFANMLQGIILFCVLAGDFLARFKIVIRKRK